MAGRGFRAGGARWLLASALALAVLAGSAREGRAAAGRPRARIAVAAERRLAIQQIDPVEQLSTLQCIEDARERLPEKYRRRGNFAWARADIAGLEKREYFAHSGIHRMGKITGEAAERMAEISLRPKKGRFEVLCVNHDDEIEGPNCWPRHVDTEYKILEDLARQMPDERAAGEVLLYTDLYPCASCRYVMRQFLTVYSNVSLRVLFREY
ncbi:MAG: hypothetical protein GX803_04710 [Lentisphaerae bacterium]|nr:hypothetical protein [Lentisphaerota bacterium]